MKTSTNHTTKTTQLASTLPLSIFPGQETQQFTIQRPNNSSIISTQTLHRAIKHPSQHNLVQLNVEKLWNTFCPQIHTGYYYYILFKRILFISIVLCTTIANAQNLSEIEIANEYLKRGETTKAISSYQTLSRMPENIPYIHNNYFRLLLENDKFKDAEDYLERVIKKYPNQLFYKLDLGILYARMGDQQKTERFFKMLFKANATDYNKLKMASDYLAARNLLDQAITALLLVRELGNNNNLFVLELANLYRLQGKRNEMVREYLNYVIQTPSNIAYIKNLLQVLITKHEEFESLESILLEKVVTTPESDVFSDLLIWVKIQQKDFYGAFVQARAFDRHFKKELSKTLELAQIALSNKDYETADKCYAFVIKEYPKTPNYLPARLGLIHTREAKVRRKYPVNKDSVRYLLKEYDAFVAAYPENPNSDEAIINEAHLLTYYLDQKDSAIHKLSQLVTSPRGSAITKSRAKLDLGDIYLLNEQPWESTLLYSQVEKSQKETSLAYDAKLRNAKLAYFNGDFKLAQEHLGILKQATTKEIANDALELSMRIRENLETDSIGAALKSFASIELLIYQNKIEKAILAIETLKNHESVASGKTAKSTILDDLYWLEADMQLKLGHFSAALALLKKINDEYGDDILADDALFMQAEIYEKQLADKDKAMEYYREFLTKFPGSVFASEARKRFRQMRGDFPEPPPVN